MTNALPAQLGLACLLIAHSLLAFSRAAAAREEKPSRSLWSLLGEAKALSAEEEYARLARKAQGFWQGGLSLRDWPVGRR